MGAGMVSSFRWQRDRKLSYREMGIFCAQHHAQVMARSQYLEEQNQELAMRVVDLNRKLARYESLVRFQNGDMVGNGISGRA